MFFELLFTCECDHCLSGSPQVVNWSLLTTGDISQCILGKRKRHLFIREQEHSRGLFREKGWHHTACSGRKYLFCPVWDNASGIWRFGECVNCNTVHYGAIRSFLGVHNFTPVLAISGDIGWELQMSEINESWFNFGTDLNMPEQKDV